MSGEKWILLAAAAALMLICLLFSLAARPRTRTYAWARRIFWASVLLWGSGALGGPGLNAVTAAVVSALGAPGYAALAVLMAMG